VRGSETRLRQLLQNLVTNAVKFGGTPTRVSVDAVRQDAEWEISVTDNGRGIPPDQLEAIFGVFRRAPGSEDIDGTGIGLAIARKIVQQHGGRIWAESTVGEGTTFRFTLPAMD
jgi:signal transduction histidine kinase